MPDKYLTIFLDSINDNLKEDKSYLTFTKNRLKIISILPIPLSLNQQKVFIFLHSIQKHNLRQEIISRNNIISRGEEI
jgi:hypothetical protein